MKQTRMTLGFFFLVLSTLLLLATCGGGDDDNGGGGGGGEDGEDDENDGDGGGEGDGDSGPNLDEDGKGPFGPLTKTTIYSYQRERTSGASAMTMDITGDITIGGQALWVAQIADVPSTLPPNEMYVKIEDDTHILFGGGKIYSSLVPVGTPGEPLVSGEVDPPLSVNLDPTPGEDVAIDITTTANFGGAQVEGTASGAYQLVETGVSVETVMGTVHGANHYAGSVTITGDTVPAYISGSEFSADVWYTQELGLVAAVIKRPPLDDVVFGLAGVSDLGGEFEGMKMIHAAGVAGPANPLFTLNTYSVHNTLDADKDQHAKMLLELRYLDETLAKGDTQPDALVEFGTAMGTYPFELVASPVSFFYPAEKELGYTYWIAFVDQAAKNESVNGIAYHISVSGGTNPVRATARILYHLYEP